MTASDQLRTELARLAELLENPFRADEAVMRLLADPAAGRLLAGGETTVHELVSFLRGPPEPALARVAVLLIARSGSDAGYAGLLDVLGQADQRLVLAFDTGLWRAPRDEAAIARDIVRVAETSRNPAPLILLQRPGAAATVKPRLQEFVRARTMPFAEFAMAALAYAADAGDVRFLTEIANAVGRPGLSAEAGIALLRLGSHAGWRGIEAGLTASDEERRVATFAALRPVLPEPLRQAPGFDPRASAGSQPEVLARLRDSLD